MKDISLKNISLGTLTALLSIAIIFIMLQIFKIPVLPNSYCAMAKYGYTETGTFNNYCPLGCAIKEVPFACPGYCNISNGEKNFDCMGW